MKTQTYFAATIVLAFIPAISVAAPPPIETFAAYEDIKDAMISPDGRYLAMISGVEGRRIALVRDLEVAGKVIPVLTAEAKNDADLEWCRWANATRLLCGLSGTTQMRQFSFPTLNLVGVDADGKNFKQLVTASMRLGIESGERGFDVIPGDTNEVLVRLRSIPSGPIEQPTYIYKLDIYTGKTTQVMSNLKEHSLWNLYSDGAGNLPLADGYGPHKDGFYTDPMGNSRILDGRHGDEQRLFAYKNINSGWSVLNKASEFSKTNPLSGLGVNAARARAYGFAQHQGRRALWEFDLDDTNAPAMVFAHPQVDVGGVVVDGLGQVIGVQYEADRPRVEYTDERLVAVMRGINKALPDTFNYIRSMSTDRKKWVIASRGDTEGGRFQLYDAESRKLAAIGSQYPALGAQQLAHMRAMDYPAQDGTKIPAFLITPADARAEKLPLVVMPHSGYHGRAHWEYDMTTQFLASRGYAVITMNYRGSDGYGKAWLEAGEEDWGGLIYSDITDAARWAVAQGIADPQRVCILGRGPSGYAALLGAIRSPDIYKCAASVGGRTDLVDLARHMRTVGPVNKSETATKNAAKKENKEDSPLQRAADVKIPVLLIHGTADTKTPFAQSEDMAKALEKAGKKYKLVKVERADSAFWREAERATLLREMEEFLAANLGT